MLLAGCKAGDAAFSSALPSSDPVSSAVVSEASEEETMTIVKLPSPPVCKITDKAGIIEEVRDYLAKMDKEKLDSEGSALSAGWQYMIRFNKNGKLYAYSFVGDIMTDSDGVQYLVDDHSLEKIQEFYDEMTESEESYTGQGQ